MRYFVVLVVASVVGCSRSQQPDIFEATFRTATELKAGQEVGMNREKFGDLLQQFATDINDAKDKAESPESKRVCEGYSSVLSVYKDAARVWDVKISMPTLKADAVSYFKSLEPDRTKGEVTKLFNFELAFVEGIPLNLYPTGATGIEDLVDKYGIPVTETHGYKTIPENAVQLIWAKASQKNDEVDKLRKGN